MPNSCLHFVTTSNSALNLSLYHYILSTIYAILAMSQPPHNAWLLSQPLYPPLTAPSKSQLSSSITIPFTLQDTYEFFRSTYGKKWQLTLRDVISLQNLWFNGIIAGTNFLVIIGTSMKIALTYKVRRYHWLLSCVYTPETSCLMLLLSVSSFPVLFRPCLWQLDHLHPRSGSVLSVVWAIGLPQPFWQSQCEWLELSG